MRICPTASVAPGLTISRTSNLECGIAGLRRENEKEFFFHTFKAGMLLKTNKSEMMGAFK